MGEVLTCWLRLARFGVEHLEAALSAQGRRVVVVDPWETART
jgi:putative resolvase